MAMAVDTAADSFADGPGNDSIAAERDLGDPATAVLGGDEEQVRAAIEEAGLTAANANGGGQIVAAGTAAELEAFAAAPPARTRVIPLKVAGAFHTEHMRPAVDDLAAHVADLSPSDPRLPLLSNRDGEAVESGTPTPTTVSDAVEALRLAEAATESARTGLAVTVG